MAVSSPIEHCFLETNKIHLHAVSAGPEDGPLVILLHGFPDFWWGWSHQIDALVEAGYRLLIPDQRGYNLSDKPRGVAAYHLQTLAADAIGLIQAMGRSSASLIGHDWGAAVAWQVAVQAPEVVNRLGILNVPLPIVMVNTLRRSIRQLLKSWYIFFFQIPYLPEILLRANNYAGLAGMMVRSGKHNTFNAEELIRYRTAWNQPGSLQAMLNWYRAAFRTSVSQASFGAFPDDLRIKIPTLILWGVNDVALSRSMAEESIKYCDTGKLIFYKHATHWVQLDEPEAVNTHLLSFLR